MRNVETAILNCRLRGAIDLEIYMLVLVFWFSADFYEIYIVRDI